MLKDSLFYKMIRRAFLRQMIAPAFLFLFSALILWLTPRENYLFPRPLNSRSHYENFYSEEFPYVSVTVPRLSYTGFSLAGGGPGGNQQGARNGYYYYTLQDGFCQFYLLEAEGGYPDPPLRENLSLTGRLIRIPDENYESLLEGMAVELGLRVSVLKARTAPYAVAQISRPNTARLLIRLACGTVLIISLSTLIAAALWYWMPERSPALSRLDKDKSPASQLARIEAGLRSPRRFQTGSLLLIPGYLLETDPERFLVVPLSSLAGGRLREPLFSSRIPNLTPRLSLLQKDGKRLTLSTAKKADPERLLSLIKEQEPDFRID